MNYARHHTRLTRRWFYTITALAFGASILLFACQPFETSPGYGNIHPRHLLLIPREGKLHITWEARHLIVTLQGSVRQGVLSINGIIKRNQNMDQFDKLDKAVVDIYLTNSAGKILKFKILYSTDRPSSTEILHQFQTSYKLPKSTTHIAFGYDLKTGNSHHRHFPIE